MRRPVIGITADSEEQGGGYSALPWYALRHNYCDAVTAAGGLAVILPHDVTTVPDVLDLIDGLLITGGAFDVDPALFGATSRHHSVVLKQRRTAFELALLKGVLTRDLPVLGICGGQQLLAVALGATLHQHIPDAVPGALAHEQPNPRTEAGHNVTVVPGTLLHSIVGQTTVAVNSAHHQAVATVPDTLVVNARAADGVIEGIEDPQGRFRLGVQWHPEYHITPADTALFTALVAAAGDRS
ncbi:gamma-glutamyl-gamma-aminobutyrate hydrolase family protein [Pararhodospirillum photometricum]|uniref:Glutamine amidotransferase class-I n=1 Tax=Pararhodospirillum photometricum DSM 122 TaxID=1150469 RepID=H6SMT1_PARPM|nr:gamma-glutamyl-gamma-aminobutyrate hydrolase family protein [Pararhodospirillum photometricum]CCG09216.1 Glutamine amidotransferase class-I [Pararhodospirillum photometricum DSM 122]